jgi:hypothetical protein
MMLTMMGSYCRYDGLFHIKAGRLRQKWEVMRGRSRSPTAVIKYAEKGAKVIGALDSVESVSTELLSWCVRFYVVLGSGRDIVHHMKSIVARLSHLKEYECFYVDYELFVRHEGAENDAAEARWRMGVG